MRNSTKAISRLLLSMRLIVVVTVALWLWVCVVSLWLSETLSVKWTVAPRTKCVSLQLFFIIDSQVVVWVRVCLSWIYRYFGSAYAIWRVLYFFFRALLFSIILCVCQHLNLSLLTCRLIRLFTTTVCVRAFTHLICHTSVLSHTPSDALSFAFQ